MSVVVLTPLEVAGGSNSRLISDDLLRPEFSLHHPEPKWISNSEVLYRNGDGHVIKFNFVVNKTDMFLTNSVFVDFKVARYSVSPDMKYALFAYDVKQVYRHSYTSSYIVYNIHTREVWELNPPEVQNAVLQHAAWGMQGQQLMYIFENNIYYQSDVRSNSLRITSSGKEGVIFNGIADWLYEEEVLRSYVAHWWSPDGARLAYLTINDSLVPNMLLPQFTGSTYPTGLHYPYPKAGQLNPTVRVFVVNLFGPTHTQELVAPSDLHFRDRYVTMVEWISTTHLSVRWLNRAQNASLLSVCEATAGLCVQRHEETSDLWLTGQEQKPMFSQDMSRFFLTTPVRQGGHGEFNHITMFTRKSRSDQSEVRHLTSGSWEVTRILAYNEDNQIIYFLSTEDSPQKRHLYSVSAVGVFPRQCLTCQLNHECSFYDAELCPSTQHVLLRCRGPGVPMVMLLSFQNPNSYYILENNAPVRAALEKKKTFKTETRAIPHEHFELPLKLTYPVDFSESFFYGLLLIVDGSPGSQSVSDEFQLGWDSVLVSSEDVIVARVDGLGTGYRGQRVLHQVHKKLGTIEVQDHVAALEYLMKLPYVDRSRIGIYGKGYGGYVSLMLLKSTDKIKCAVAMAPVTNWTMYASAFSERYLGLLSEGENRYQASSVLQNMKTLHGQDLLLVHGTADANVHFQHSAELIQRLIKIGANYSMQIYPDEGHFLSPKSQRHFTESLIGYFRVCLHGYGSLLPEQPKEEE
ncbi:inactive dipeptidyl peptidase 10-like [Osmerus mordax]|uniref:inactive dipeptidyl peptidase 10-like n=1 Tax=Osmerus mordax TaxID=8014 RepID=UPI00350F16C8